MRTDVPGPDEPVLDLVVPVYNEETDLAPCVRRLHANLTATFPYPFRITVADNGSTDGTLHVAHTLAGELSGIGVLHVAEKGRGRALRAAWTASHAQVLAYTDVDLSTDLAALLPLVAPLLSGHSDVSIGTRLTGGARVVRGAKRECISRCYNLILHSALHADFSDAQCGFKAIRKDVADQVLPLIQDTGFFFDTELLILAQRAGLRIHEVPVDWVDDPDTRVDILATALADLMGIARLAREVLTATPSLTNLRAQFGRAPLQPDIPGVPVGMPGQLARFTTVGVLSTAAYLALFAAIRLTAGAQLANLLALLITAVVNTTANRRLTFGVHGRERAVLHQFQGMLIFALGLAMTSGALAALNRCNPHPTRILEMAVLVVANLSATLVRFLLMRGWVFRPTG
ncbi:glycosyltransferase [Dactylosporangium siamense]|uniref:glycosyltransferase n=1 Tax=Dactylosporangium siamense TaxID=685454 RepID=UPI001EF1E149|nr:glycosyltransferase [Dactylosporangium siamense]